MKLLIENLYRCNERIDITDLMLNKRSCTKKFLVNLENKINNEKYKHFFVRYCS